MNTGSLGSRGVLLNTRSITSAPLAMFGALARFVLAARLHWLYGEPPPAATSHL